MAMLSAHFSESEFACKHCGELPPMALALLC